MSRGQTNKHSLRGTSPAQIVDWARTLPLAFVGVIVHKSASQSFADATLTNMAFNVVDFETDKFFGSPVDSFTIPDELGGIYGATVDIINDEVAFYTIRLSVAVTRDGTTTTLCRCSFIVDPNDAVSWSPIIPFVFQPGDVVHIQFLHFEGHTVIMLPHVPSATEMRAPQIMFYRYSVADQVR